MPRFYFIINMVNKDVKMVFKYFYMIGIFLKTSIMVQIAYHNENASF